MSVSRVAYRYIRVTAGIGVGRTVENGSVRIHRYRDHYRITDLTNAGKRGKTVDIAVVMPSYRYEGDRDTWLESVGDAIVHFDRYAEVLAYFKKLAGDVPGQIQIDESRAKGIEVEPGGLTTVRVKTTPAPDGSYMVIESSPVEWSVKSVAVMTGPKGNTFNQDTLYYPYGGKRDITQGAAVFNKWLQGNFSRVNKMTIGDLRDVWKDLGVKYDSH